MTQSNKRAMLVFVIIGIVILSYQLGKQTGFRHGYRSGGNKAYSHGYEKGVREGTQTGINKYKNHVESLNIQEPKPDFQQKKPVANRKETKFDKQIPYEAKILEHGWYDYFVKYNGDKILPSQDDWLIVVFTIQNDSDSELTHFHVKFVDDQGIEFNTFTDDISASVASGKIVKEKYPKADSNPDINPKTSRIVYALFDVPKDINPVSLRINFGLFGSNSIDLALPKE